MNNINEIKDIFYTSTEIVEFKHFRVSIFASYSSDKVIDDSVVFYLKELRKVCDAIIFVADNPTSESEFAKIKDTVIYAQFSKHDKYDFGSYAIGFNWLKSSEIYNKTNELIFCNDSVYGPYYPLSRFFEKRSLSKCNMFYGHTINYIAIERRPDKVVARCLKPHIQSYFFILDKKIFTSSFFSDFLSGVKTEQSKADIIINYELGLTKVITENGYDFDAYFSEKLYNDPCKEFSEHFDKMLFIKKNRVKYYHNYYLNKLLGTTAYPFNIISKKIYKKSTYIVLLSKLYFIFEVNRLIRENDYYKKRRFKKKMRNNAILAIYRQS